MKGHGGHKSDMSHGGKGKAMEHGDTGRNKIDD